MAFSVVDLMKKFAGKTVVLTTRCGTFEAEPGTIKDVFDDFFMFLTEDVGTGKYTIRNFVPYSNVGVLTLMAETGESIEIMR